MARSTRCRGFVLLLTLILLALAAVLMVELSCTSLERTAAALDAERLLQQRWAVASIHRSLLPQIEQLLQAEEQRQEAPVVEWAVPIVLSEHHYLLVLADEQAKVNLNEMYLRGGYGDTSRVVSALAGAAGAGLAVNLRADPRARAANMPSALEGTAPILPFGTWAQIFDSPSPDDLLIPDLAGGRPVKDITCWGDAQLNIMRASAYAIWYRASGRLSKIDAQELVKQRQQLYEQDPEAKEQGESEGAVPSAPSVSWFLGQLDVDSDDRRALEAEWTTTSRCHSVTVIRNESSPAYYTWSTLTQVVPPEKSKPASGEDAGRNSKNSDGELESAIDATVPCTPGIQRLVW